MGVPYFLLLNCLGLAITAQAQDCSRPPIGPNMSLSDKDILLEQFPDGTTVSFVCDVGYTSAGGSRTITCTGGTWSTLRMRCEKKNCGPFEEIENGEIDYSEGTEFGAKIVITCNPGYALVGRGEIICQNDGWNGRKPTCEVVTCDPPANVEHGSFTPDEQSYNYRDVVQYSCQTGFTLNGSKSISCSDDGTFQPAPPTCTRVQCEEPVIKNGEWVSGSRPPYGHKATVTYKCSTGFKINGSPTIVCDLNSQWSPKLPTCEMVTCSPPPKVEHGSFSPGKESYNYTNVVQYSCQTGYKLSGSKSLSCSDDGTFKPAPPTCTMVTCSPPPKVDHGSFSPGKESYNYGNAVEYSCQTGFILSGPKSLSCSDDGTFEPAPPTCTMVTCAPPPEIEHGSFSPAKKSYNYTNVVEYSCQTGFKLSGSKSVSCSDDGTFKPAAPTCTRIPTTPKATTTTTTTTTTPPRTKPKEDDGKGPPDDAHKNLGLGLGIFGGILAIGLGIGFYFFGIPALKKKKGTDRTHPDCETPKVEENVPLSQPQPSS